MKKIIIEFKLERYNRLPDCANDLELFLQINSLKNLGGEFSAFLSQF